MVNINRETSEPADTMKNQESVSSGAANDAEWAELYLANAKAEAEAQVDTINKAVKSPFATAATISTVPVLPPPCNPAPMFTVLQSLMNPAWAASSQSIFNPETGGEDQETTNEDPKISDEKKYSSTFERRLAKTKKHSSDKAKLRFAFYNPDVDMSNEELSDGTKVGEELASMIQELKTLAAKKGIDVSQLAVDNSDYNLELSIAYDSNFEQTINNAKNLSNIQKRDSDFHAL